MDFETAESPVLKAEDLLALVGNEARDKVVKLEQDDRPDRPTKAPPRDVEVEGILGRVLGRPGIADEGQPRPGADPFAADVGPMVEEDQLGLKVSSTAMNAIGSLGGPQSLDSFISDVTEDPMNMPSSKQLEAMLSDLLKRA